MAKKTKLPAPNEMSTPEKKAFARIVETLTAQGINPEARAHLIEDFVYSESSMVALRAEYKTTKGSQKLAISRAINVASAERRRIHSALFAETKSSISQPQPSNRKQQESFSEGDKEWLTYLQDQKRLLALKPPRKPKLIDVSKFVKSVGKANPQERALTKKYGSPGFAVLFHPSIYP